MKIKAIFLLIVLTLIGTHKVNALVYSGEDLPNNSYIIGNKLYTRDVEELSGYEGYLTTNIIIGASTLNGIEAATGELGDLIQLISAFPFLEPSEEDYDAGIPNIIYKDAFGNFKDALTGKILEYTGFSVNATHINNVRIISAPKLTVDFSNCENSTCKYSLWLNSPDYLSEILTFSDEPVVRNELYEVLDINAIDFIGDGTTAKVIDESGIRYIGRDNSEGYPAGTANIPLGETKIYLTKTYYTITGEDEDIELESTWGVEIISAGLETKVEEVNGKYVLSSNIDEINIDQNVRLYSSPVYVYSRVEIEQPSFTDWLDTTGNTNIGSSFDYFTERYDRLQRNQLNILYRSNPDEVTTFWGDLYLRSYYISDEEDEETNGKYYLYADEENDSEVVKDDLLPALQFEYSVMVEDEDGDENEIQIPFKVFADSLSSIKMPIKATD